MPTRMIPVDDPPKIDRRQTYKNDVLIWTKHFTEAVDEEFFFEMPVSFGDVIKGDAVGFGGRSDGPTLYVNLYTNANNELMYLLSKPYTGQAPF